jgi:hypothetical protein
MHAFVQKTEVMREEEQVLHFMVGRTGSVLLSSELAIGRLARSSAIRAVIFVALRRRLRISPKFSLWGISFETW